MKKNNVFSNLLESQNKIHELISTVVLVAIGVNILSTGVVELFNFPNKEIVFILIGAVILVSVIVKTIKTRLKSLNQTISIDGFFIYNQKEKAIVKVPQYNISGDMVKYLDSAFSENKALEMLWKQNHIAHFNIKTGEYVKGNSSQSGVILNELLEYCVIEKLSTLLTDYYNGCSDQLKIKEYGRSDIPEILLQNRFLKLFSEDMENRIAFAGSEFQKKKKQKKSTIIAAYSSSAIYKKFDLILPEKSKMFRKNKNTIVLVTPLLKLSITSSFDGFSTVLPSGFYSYYLGIENPMQNYSDYTFKVEVVADFKLKSLFSKEKEVYYAWIDRFFDMLTDYMGEKEYFERINWSTVYTMIQCNLNLHNVSHSGTNDEREDFPE